MNKTKIYYYCPSVPATDSLLFMPTPPLYLNSYLKIFHSNLADRLEWKKFQFFQNSKSNLIESLINLDIDILCITLYIWNNRQVLEQIKNIKTQLKKPIQIIVGGPSTEIVRNKNFLDQNPDIDFAIYSQGEQAFRDVLNHIFKIKKLNLLSSKNIAWRENNRTKIADFEFKRLEKISPYTNSKELIQQIVNDTDYKNWKFVLPYETSRGCPYNCSFCDWTSGLTHKTYYRKFDIESELEFLAENGITNFHLSDANFGQIDQDLEIAQTWVKLKKTKGYDFKIHNTNFAKLQKNRVFKIVDILLEGDILSNIKFAVQDTNENILNNIERPDIPWLEHKSYLDNLQEKYPQSNFHIELIQGLPGQTRETWENNFIITAPYHPIVYPWTILPNSPAGYDEEYRKKMKIRYVNSNFPFINEINTDQNLLSDTVIETYSYSTMDYAYFSLLTFMFTNKKIASIILNKDRTKIINFVKNHSDLGATLQTIQNAILTCDLELLRATATNFIKKIVVDNKNYFSKNEVKKLLSGE